MDGGEDDLELVVSAVGDVARVRAIMRDLAARNDVHVDDVVLATSELVTNALLYTPGPARVHARHRPGGPMRVEVSDPSSTPPTTPTVAEPTSTTGRGLLIVDRLAARWGVDLHGRSGKTVWFEIDPRLDH